MQAPNAHIGTAELDLPYIHTILEKWKFVPCMYILTISYFSGKLCKQWPLVWHQWFKV
jgi:hypothetical protein